MLYDLSQPVHHDAPQWADYDPIVLTQDYNLAVDGFFAERVNLTTHSGTHVDAPFHFYPEKETMDQLPLHHFFGPMITLDVRGKKPCEPISKNDLAPQRAKIHEGDIVLLKTGWGEKREKTREYLLEFPYLDGEGANFLLSLHVKGVGTDCLSIGGYGPPAVGRPAHLKLLGAGKIIIEDLRIPVELLDGRRRMFAAFPIRLTGTGGAWARAVAWDPGDL
jgi:kynurenine formamidase